MKFLRSFIKRKPNVDMIIFNKQLTNFLCLYQEEECRALQVIIIGLVHGELSAYDNMIVDYLKCTL